MSKVIKSFAVQIHVPRKIELESGFCLDDDINTDNENSTPVSEPPETVSPDDIEDLNSQAKKILEETEQMVKDLLETAKCEAEKIVKKAQEEADGLIKTSRVEADKIAEDAFQKGWNEGYVKGKEQAGLEYADKLKEAAEMVETAWEERRQIILDTEEEIIKLSVAIASKIIGSEVSLRPDLIVGIVQKAIQKATDRDELIVRVSSENMDSVSNAKESITRSLKGAGKLKLISDNDITPGGCVVESSNGTVDARIESQLNEIQKSLLDVNSNA